jgi:hypothetical protein
MTGLELAEHYQDIKRSQGFETVAELARYLGKLYRTIKNIYKLNKLCAKAKKAIRQAAKNGHRRSLSPAKLGALHVESSAAEQVRQVQRLIK